MCQWDYLKGKKEVEEDPDSLHSEPNKPDNLADFNNLASDGKDESSSATDLLSPLSSPPLSPIIPPTLLPSTQSPNLTPFSNIITLTLHALSKLATSSTPMPSLSLLSLTKPPDSSRPQKRRKCLTAAIAKNKTRKDEKKQAKTNERRGEQRLPVHGNAYVQQYLKADTVC